MPAVSPRQCHTHSYVTSSVTSPIECPWSLSYRLPIGKNLLPATVSDILSLKCYEYMTSLLTSQHLVDYMRTLQRYDTDIGDHCVKRSTNSDKKSRRRSLLKSELLKHFYRNDVFSMTSQGPVTSWVMWPFYSALATCYTSSIETKHVSLLVYEIFSFKYFITSWRHHWRHFTWINYLCGPFRHTMQ